MALDILLIVMATSAIQSMFGVGVLLFGTPLLLLFGYDFFYALTILLPISLTINGIQTVRYHEHIDRPFLWRILCITLPFIIIFLALVIRVQININYIVGAFLLLIAARDFFPGLQQALARTTKYRNTYHMVMGMVHGMSNLGGALLTALIHQKQMPKKSALATIAASYATFAMVQLMTLGFAGQGFFTPAHAGFVLVGMLVYVLTDMLVFARMDQARYRLIFSGFLVLSGLTLLMK